MTASEVQAILNAEIAGDWSRTNSHRVDLRRCLVTPRKIACRNTFPRLNAGKPLQLWIVLEEIPGDGAGYLIVYDDQKRVFGLADWDGDTPVFLGYHGDFLNTLDSM